MNNTTFLYLILIIVDFVFSFLAALWETSITATPIYKWMHQYKDRKKTVCFWTVKKIINNYNISLGAWVILNNIANITCATLTTLLVQELFANWMINLSTWILTILIIIFCEYLPKSIGKHHGVWWLKTTWWILYVFWFVFYPISWVFTMIFRDKTENVSISEEEIHTLLMNAKNEKVIERDEKILAINALKFDDIQANATLTENYLSIQWKWNFDEIKECIANNRKKNNYVVVFRHNKPYGCVDIKDLLINENGDYWHHLVKKLRLVKHTIRLDDLYMLIRYRDIKMVGVLNKKKELIGIVTYHSIIRKLFEDYE